MPWSPTTSSDEPLRGEGARQCQDHDSNHRSTGTHTLAHARASMHARAPAGVSLSNIRPLDCGGNGRLNTVRSGCVVSFEESRHPLRPSSPSSPVFLSTSTRLNAPGKPRFIDPQTYLTPHKVSPLDTRKSWSSLACRSEAVMAASSTAVTVPRCLIQYRMHAVVSAIWPCVGMRGQQREGAPVCRAMARGTDGDRHR